MKETLLVDSGGRGGGNAGARPGLSWGGVGRCDEWDRCQMIAPPRKVGVRAKHERSANDFSLSSPKNDVLEITPSARVLDTYGLHTNIPADRQSHQQTNKQTDRDQWKAETATDRHKRNDRQANKRTHRQTDDKTDTNTGRQPDRQTNRQTDTPKERQTDRDKRHTEIDADRHG